ncbi:MAG TPA: glycosyltransferase [Candidatus Limnocylindrales bacterium]
MTEPQDPDDDPLAWARIRAARERGRFEHDLDETRALLERRTNALRRTEAKADHLQRELDRLRADPIVRAWHSIRRIAGAVLRRRRGAGPASGGSAVVEPQPDGTSGGADESAPAVPPDTGLRRGPGRRLAVLGDGADALRPILALAGWDMVDDPMDGRLDVALVLDPDLDVAALPREVARVAWIRNEAGPWLTRHWLDDLDLVLLGRGVSDAELEAIVGAPVRLEEATELPAALDQFADRRRLAIVIGPATWDDAGHWGDLSFARAIERALRRRGWATHVLVDGEADGPIARRADVALHIVGVRRPTLHPGQIHLLWVISHPDEVRPGRCDAYDAVFVASDDFAEQLRLRVRVPVIALHQATDPHRFFPEPGGPSHDLLLVGNARRGGRAVLEGVAGRAWDLAVYGPGWRPETLDPRHFRGSWIPNQDLHRYYAAAEIVLNDHWADMRDEGFISNRIYDALASGAFVLSDEVRGLAAEFDGGVATWHDVESLRAAVAQWLPDRAARRAMADRGRRAVLERHTFDQRVAMLLETIDRLTEAATA